MRMTSRQIGYLSVVSVVIVFGSAAASGADEKASPRGIRFFEEKIRPVLVSRCYKCHSVRAATAKRLKGKLLLDTRVGVRTGGESGPAVVPGKPADSLLIAALRY